MTLGFFFSLRENLKISPKPCTQDERLEIFLFLSVTHKLNFRKFAGVLQYLTGPLSARISSYEFKDWVPICLSKPTVLQKVKQRLTSVKHYLLESQASLVSTPRPVQIIVKRVLINSYILLSGLYPLTTPNPKEGNHSWHGRVLR